VFTFGKIELARSLCCDEYDANNPRIGVEFEFKIDKLSVPLIKDQLILIGAKYPCIVTDEFYASFDFSDLIEFRSYPMAIDEFTYDTLFHLRRTASQWLRDHDINFIWYGWHFSLWGVPERNLGQVTIQRALGNEKVLLHSEVFSEEEHQSGWTGNTWRDPFTRKHHLHKFVEAKSLINQKARLKYDRTSMRLGWLWFARNHDLLQQASNRLPVPGCAIRVGSKRRIELVAGWMDIEFEKRVVESMIAMQHLPLPDSIPEQPNGTIRFPGSRRRVATMLLPGMSYSVPPKIPDVDWESVSCNTSWRPVLGEPWPIIGDIPNYWLNDQAPREFGA